MLHRLTINGGVLALPEALDLSQRYEPIGGFSRLRMANGAGVRQEHWRRVRTTITGRGWTPAALAAVDWTEPVTIGCIAPKAIRTSSLIVALPAARRLDLVPYVWAVLSNGQCADAACSIVGDTLTITAVAAASAYLVHYWPVLTVWCDGPVEDVDVSGAVTSWQLTAEEV